MLPRPFPQGLEWGVNGFQDVTINLIASAVAFLLGVGTRSGVRLLRAWRGRRFWGRAIAREETLLLLGTIPKFKRYEPSGLIGAGDSRAVQELASMFGDLGIDFKTSYAEKLIDGDQEHNLVLLGSEEVNDVVEGLRQRIHSSFRFYSGPMKIVDLDTGDEYEAQWLDGRDQVCVDYGILIRAESPFRRDRTVVIISGVYGFGTWAGARVTKNPDFLSRCRALKTFNIECLYRVQVIQNIPLKIDILDVRALAQRPPSDPPIDLRVPKPNNQTQAGRTRAVSRGTSEGLTNDSAD